MNILDLARTQFGVTGAIHFLFVVLTLGLAPLVAIMHTRFLLTDDPLHERMTRFWGQIYVINYALGIMSGIVMEFQFGLNWSGLAHYAGDVFGAPLAMETMIAFFLESTFLGLWIFGWHRLPRWPHLLCIWLVAATAWASALFIMVANSFLQNPAGATLIEGRLALTDPAALFTNPTLVMALPHVLSAGLTTAGFVLMGASAYKLFKRTADRTFFVKSMRWGIVTASIGSLLVVGFGYAQFGALGDLQPDKFETSVLAGFGLGVMMLIGNLVQLLTMFVLLPLIKWLPSWRWTQPLLMAMTPLPFIAAICGWLARESGRQPWLVQGKLTVADALTPGLTSGQIIGSFAVFGGLLATLAVVDWLLIFRAVRRGPAAPDLGAAPAVPQPVLTY